MLNKRIFYPEDKIRDAANSFEIIDSTELLKAARNYKPINIWFIKKINFADKTPRQAKTVNQTCVANNSELTFFEYCIANILEAKNSIKEETEHTPDSIEDFQEKTELYLKKKQLLKALILTASTQGKISYLDTKNKILHIDILKQNLKQLFEAGEFEILDCLIENLDKSNLQVQETLQKFSKDNPRPKMPIRDLNLKEKNHNSKSLALPIIASALFTGALIMNAYFCIDALINSEFDMFGSLNQDTSKAIASTVIALLTIGLILGAAYKIWPSSEVINPLKKIPSTEHITVNS